MRCAGRPTQRAALVASSVPWTLRLSAAFHHTALIASSTPLPAMTAVALRSCAATTLPLLQASAAAPAALLGLHRSLTTSAAAAAVRAGGCQGRCRRRSRAGCPPTARWPPSALAPPAAGGEASLPDGQRRGRAAAVCGGRLGGQEARDQVRPPRAQPADAAPHLQTSQPTSPGSFSPFTLPRDSYRGVLCEKSGTAEDVSVIDEAPSSLGK